MIQLDYLSYSLIKGNLRKKLNNIFYAKYALFLSKIDILFRFKIFAIILIDSALSPCLKVLSNIDRMVLIQTLKSRLVQLVQV